MRGRTGRYTTRSTASSHVQTASTQKPTVDSVILPTEDAAGPVQGAFIRATTARNQGRVEMLVEWAFGIVVIIAMLASITRGR